MVEVVRGVVVVENMEEKVECLVMEVVVVGGFLKVQYVLWY